jgi:hypothetical protein
MSVIGTGLKWLVAALGLVVWLGGVGFSGLMLWQADLDVLNKVVGSVGLFVAFILSVLLLRGTGELSKFLLCVFFGGIALFAVAPNQFGAANLEETTVTEVIEEPAAEELPTPGASAGVSEGAPKPVAEPPGAQPSAPAPEIKALESRVTQAEEKYIEASKKLARARTMVVKPDIGVPAPSKSPAGSAGGPVRGIPAPAPSATPAPPPPPPEAPIDLKILEQEVARAEVKYLDASKELASAKLEPARMEMRSAAITADTYPADLRFNKPSTMELGKSYVVEATIAAPGDTAPTAGLGSTGPTVSRDIEITRKVRVELIANDFKVDKLHTIDTVLIQPGSSGQWSWRVTPQTEGIDRKMLLQVWGVQEENGVVIGDKMIRVYEEKIPVTVTPIGRVTSIANKVISSWEMVAGIFGVLGGIWMFLGNIGKALRGKKEETAPASA